jgi:hypothetical protein
LMRGMKMMRLIMMISFRVATRVVTILHRIHTQDNETNTHPDPFILT